MRRQRRYWVLLTHRGELAYPVLYPYKRGCLAAALADEQVVEIKVEYGRYTRRRSPKPLFGDARGAVANILRARR